MAGPLYFVRSLNSGLRFALELAALYSLGRFGYSLSGALIRVAGVVVLPATMVVVWGTLIAPKARIKLPVMLRLGLELVVFGAASYALGVTSGQAWGWSFLGVSTLSSWLNAASERDYGRL
jgi:hypothetical protein